ncbi:MAG TPA: Gfo/Idh/MocA family oxidoreductase [Planctomycetaceae bacterium]|nr:Gfo/Idh/MocA family oxidoreductase [Planctomycetaceae bacterium]HIQ23246.1 Gfo/Idh/MocA family oxidoreductase [Planctomycetota bacterium]
MIRVGIAGIGFMGMIHYLAYQRVRGAKVQAICEKIPERLAGDWRSIKGNFGPRGQIMDLTGISKYSELDDLLADPKVDLVDVCLPPWQHAQVSIAALKAGKHVFCEKPIALKTSHADRMVKAAQQAGRLLMIGQVLPFFAAYRFALKTIQTEKYGRLLGGNFVRIISDPQWLKDFYDPDGCGGPMVDLHIHDAHFIRLICGMPRAVHSVGRVRGEVLGFCNTQFLYDDPSLVVTATSGVIDQQGRPFTNGYEIHLERATLVFDSWMGQPVTVLTDDGRVRHPKLAAGDEIDAFAEEIKEVVRSVRTQTPSSLLDGQLARDALVLAHKQTQSVIQRRTVRI